MAPRPPATDRFRIGCDNVEAHHVGSIVAQFTRLGYTNVHFELITDVRTFRQNAKHEVNAEDFLGAWIAEHPTFTSKEAVTHFREHGRMPGSVYYALAQLVEKKTLKKLSNTNYARADVKHIEAGKHIKKAKAAAPKKKKDAVVTRKTFNKTGEHAVLSHARRNHGRFNTTKLVEMFKHEGRGRGSVYASINKLLTEKMVKRVGDPGSGEYVLTAKASSKPSETKKPAPKTNGNGAHVHAEQTEAVING